MHEPELSREALAALPPDIVDSPLFNADLAPVPPARRNWTTYNFAALWISMAHCIPTYMLAGGLVAVGMNWWQALLTIGLGNVIVLGPILLNAHPGTKYGIPFPVLARASFGTSGANIPAIIRGLRALSDFEFEFNMALMNRHLDGKIETIFVMPSEQFSYTSSSLVKQIAKLGGDMAHFVPANVATALKKKFAA